MSKGSGFTRAVQYFRTADLTEAQACLHACNTLVGERTSLSEAEVAPKPRRKRRTKAEIAADRTADDNLTKGATA